MDQKRIQLILGITTAVVAVSLVFVGYVFAELTALKYILSIILIALLGVLIWLNQQVLRNATRTRSAKYGANAAITVALVAALLIVANFLNYNHYYRKDLTRNQVHSLSEQTIKILKDLKSEIKFTAFARSQERDRIKQLFDKYAYYGKKLKTEFVDPDRDPVRAKAANVKEYQTVIVSGPKKETRIQDPNEEKLTNALIKVTKDRATQICFMQGHGEKSPELNQADGYSQMKKELQSQTYDSKTFNFLEEGKIPQDCDVVLVLGPTKAFFPKEVEGLSSWLDDGGRAVVALDPSIRGNSDHQKEIKGLLEKWFVEVSENLVIDPFSRMANVNATVPLAGNYSTDHPAVKDFRVSALFPVTSTVSIKANPPGTLKTWWLAKSTPKAFAKSDFKEIASGQVSLDPKKDKAGPHDLIVAVEGSRTDKKAARASRLVVLGTSALGVNAFTRFGGNADLFLNMVSWLADDENLISIRAKEEELQAPTLTVAEGRFVQLLTMVLIPGTVLATGAGMWFRRRRL